MLRAVQLCNLASGPRTNGTKGGRPEHVLTSLWVPLGLRCQSAFFLGRRNLEMFSKVVIFCEQFSKDKKEYTRQVRESRSSWHRGRWEKG